MLIVSMIILLVMSLLAIQGMQTAKLEEKMAGNFRDKKIAFEAAETALLAAEAWISEQTQAPLATDQGEEGGLIFGAAGLTSPSLWDNDKPWVHRVANAEQYLPAVQAPRPLLAPQ